MREGGRDTTTYDSQWGGGGLTQLPCITSIIDERLLVKIPRLQSEVFIDGICLAHTTLHFMVHFFNALLGKFYFQRPRRSFAKRKDLKLIRSFGLLESFQYWKDRESSALDFLLKINSKNMRWAFVRVKLNVIAPTIPCITCIVDKIVNVICLMLRDIKIV